MLDENVERLLKLVAKHDACGCIFWTEKLEFFIGCNDMFWWATADAEEIKTVDDITLLEKCLGDSEAFGFELYCCRKRAMRPQGAYYKYIDKKDWHLFDACGPRREADNEPFGNPHNQDEFA